MFVNREGRISGDQESQDPDVRCMQSFDGKAEVGRLSHPNCQHCG